jgi:hypothetical protein
MESDWVGLLQNILNSYTKYTLQISVIIPIIQELFDFGVNPRNFLISYRDISVQCSIPEIEAKQLVESLLNQIGSVQ